MRARTLLFREFDRKASGGALHFDSRLFAGGFDLLFGLSVNAGDLRLRFAANAVRFALPLFPRARAQRRNFLFEIAQFLLNFGGPRIGFGFGAFAGGEAFLNLFRCGTRAAGRPVSRPSSR